MPVSPRVLLPFLVPWILSLSAGGREGHVIYDDSRRNGWEDWGWADIDYAATDPVRSGERSVRVTAGPWQALYLHHAGIATDDFQALRFWIHGGGSGGQQLVVRAVIGGEEAPGVPVPAPLPGEWREVSIPLDQLGAAGVPDLDGLWFQNAGGDGLPSFHLDEIGLVAEGPPDEVRLAIDAGKTVGTIDRRHFGINLGMWDGRLGQPESRELLGEMGARTLRFPGGSLSDDYDWSTNRQLSTGGPFRWVSGPRVFAETAMALGAEAYVTVNYGSGTPEMAAAWVAWANGDPGSGQPIGTDSRGRDWRTVGFWASLRASPAGGGGEHQHLRAGHPEPFGFRYWEVGNEVYGHWEFDLHGEPGSGLSGAPNDAVTYAAEFERFCDAMKAVDPAIEVGAVVIAGRDSYPGGVAVPNPSGGGAKHDGWTPRVLAGLAGLGVTPDFAAHHFYAQDPKNESDPGLLASSRGIVEDAVDLRQQLADYLGPAGAGVELAMTEINSVSFDPGKQTTNLANALFRADSLAVLAATEFRSCVWWAFRNGRESGNNNGTALYGWRGFGDYGVVSEGPGGDRRMPSFHASAMLARWADHGDKLVGSTSDFSGLACHAVRSSSGKVSLLVINRSASHNLSGRIVIDGFEPVPDGMLLRYGKPEDRADGPPTESPIADAAGEFLLEFPAYSISVIELRSGLPADIPRE